MTSVIASARYIHCLVMAIVLCGCRSSTPLAPVRVVDLIHEMDRADKRPPGGFAIAMQQVDGVARPVIAAAVPSRLTLALPLPRHGVFHALVALADGPPVRGPHRFVFVSASSDHRITTGVKELILTPGTRTWIDLRADCPPTADEVESILSSGWDHWRVFLAADQRRTYPRRYYGERLKSSPNTESCACE